MKLEHVLYGFGILFCLAGIGYLAAEYVSYLSDWGRLGALVLAVGFFGFIGKYFEKVGW